MPKYVPLCLIFLSSLMTFKDASANKHECARIIRRTHELWESVTKWMVQSGGVGSEELGEGVKNLEECVCSHEFAFCKVILMSAYYAEHLKQSL